MACSVRGPGPLLSIWVQNDPTHSQVSPSTASPLFPPNNTVRPRWESKVIAWLVRCPGPKSDLCVHKNLPIVSHLLLNLSFTCSTGAEQQYLRVDAESASQAPVTVPSESRLFPI